MEMPEKVYVKDNCYATKGRADTALGFGIAGTALSGLALWNQHNRNCGGSWGGNYGYGSPAVLSGGVAVASEAMHLERKECEDVIALTRSIYDNRIVDITEKNELERYLSNKIAANDAKDNQVAFDLYKNQRDQFDILKNEIDKVKCEVAVVNGIRPYQDQILRNEIHSVGKQSQWGIALEAERRCCADERIIAYSNGTFATQGVAQPTFSTTIVPKAPFDPLCCGCGNGSPFNNCGCNCGI